MRFKYIPMMSLCFLTFFASCSLSKDKEIAQESVDLFHSQLDSERYDVMYDAADEALQKGTSKAEFIRLLEGVHRKLGKVQRSQLRNFQSGWFTGAGRAVTLEYDTTFAGGNGREQFVWHIREDRPILFGYHIESNALVEK